MLQPRAAYYGAIGADAVLRFGWTATLVPGGISSLPTEGVLWQACARACAAYSSSPPPSSSAIVVLVL